MEKINGPGSTFPTLNLLTDVFAVVAYLSLEGESKGTDPMKLRDEGGGMRDEEFDPQPTIHNPRSLGSGDE